MRVQVTADHDGLVDAPKDVQEFGDLAASFRAPQPEVDRDARDVTELGDQCSPRMDQRLPAESDEPGRPHFSRRPHQHRVLDPAARERRRITAHDHPEGRTESTKAATRPGLLEQKDVHSLAANNLCHGLHSGAETVDVPRCDPDL